MRQYYSVGVHYEIYGNYSFNALRPLFMSSTVGWARACGVILTFFVQAWFLIFFTNRCWDVGCCGFCIIAMEYYVRNSSHTLIKDSTVQFGSIILQCRAGWHNCSVEVWKCSSIAVWQHCSKQYWSVAVLQCASIVVRQYCSVVVLQWGCITVW